MPKIDSKTLKNAIFAHKGRSRVVNGHKNHYIDVISPASASEIRRALGIKKENTQAVSRIFADVGIRA
jgi:hypothetical protein